MGFLAHWIQKPITSYQLKMLYHMLQTVLSLKHATLLMENGRILVADKHGLGEPFIATTHSAGRHFCDTGVDNPYRDDILKAIICLYEIGGCYDMGANYPENQFFYQLEIVHELHPLETFEEQCAYFRRIIRQRELQGVPEVIPPADQQYLADLRTTVAALEARLAELERRIREHPS